GPQRGPGDLQPPAAVLLRAHSAAPWAPGSTSMAYLPVIIERMLFQVPDATTITRWTMTKATIRLAQIKWIERADWRPPNRLSSQGAAASKPGDMVSPVPTISGSSNRITAR